MDIMGFIDGTVDFVKTLLDIITGFWNGLSESKKKAFMGVVVVAVILVVVAAVAYRLGRISGEKDLYSDDEF